MSRIIAVCGRLCGGKTAYARQLVKRENAVLLSTDEVMLRLFARDLGTEHDGTVCRVQAYLLDRAAEIVQAGTNVVLDWGFWTAASRRELRAFAARKGIRTEWHAIRISDTEWEACIIRRNAAVSAGLSSDYYVDEGLRCKFLELYEAPDDEEIDVWTLFSPDTKKTGA